MGGKIIKKLVASFAGKDGWFWRIIEGSKVGGINCLSIIKKIACDNQLSIIKKSTWDILDILGFKPANETRCVNIGHLDFLANNQGRNQWGERGMLELGKCFENIVRHWDVNISTS